jgi:hypothetical protein
LQYYLENIVRQQLPTEVPEICEIAFWKTIDFLEQLNPTSPKSTIPVYTTDIIISNFINSQTSTAGWAELILQIENQPKQLIPSFRDVENIPNIIQCPADVDALYDNGSFEFLFTDDQKKVFDFNNTHYNIEDEGSFDFNTMLLFYRMEDTIDRLHGINFVQNYQNQVSFWDMPRYNCKTNAINSTGYQFNFNMKTVNNESTLKIIQENEEVFYSLYSKTLGLLETFLETKIHE